MVVTVAPVPTLRFSRITVPEPLALIKKSSFDLLVEIELSLIVISFKIIPPVPDVLKLKSAFVGATKFCIDISPSPAKTKPVPAEFTLRTCPAVPIELRPVPPFETGTVSPLWNSAIPVATFELLKTTRTGVLSVIMFSYCPRPSCNHRMDILLTSVFIVCFKIETALRCWRIG